MTSAEIAKEIKSLAGMLSIDREKVEDRIFNFTPFPSGLISYSWEPVEEAIKQYEEFIEGWKFALRYPKEYGKAHSEIETIIANAEDIIDRLKK